MKVNKWTVGLAAAGLVSLTSVQAEEKVTPLLTALSSTTISGYVDTAGQWNPGTGSIAPGYAFSAGKRDRFSLNSVLVSLEKPLTAAEFSAGYHVDLMFGPDAVGVGGDGTAGNENVRQAYVALRVPVGNGLDFKLGRFDDLLGYESSDSYKNPNYTRSYGYTITPTEHTGLLATYQVSSLLSVNVGAANTLNTGAINATSGRAESHKTFMGSVTLTAPDSTGFLAGSALYLGAQTGFGSKTENESDLYVGGSLATPVQGLRLGAAFDYDDHPTAGGNNAWAVAGYASFKATDKLGLHLRGEYAKGTQGFAAGGTVNPEKVLAATVTVQYDLWDNVLSRLEARWDRAVDGTAPYASGNHKNDFMIAANLVYKF
jgi:hypothetical protein